MKTKLLIFGITGDLSTRKLLPAISKIVGADAVDDLEIIGVSRRDVDVAQLLQMSLGEQNLADFISIFSMDLAHSADYTKLKSFINLTDDEQLLVYLSVPPQAAAQIVDFMGEAGINTPNVKLLFEKPFGVDYESASEVIERTASHFDESQIYRIDHYLAKEMAQNIVALRGGNALFSHIWDSSSIESIEICALEKITIEGRAQFYEQTGALRDVVQGHLMQLLALMLMEIPDEFDWNKVPSARAVALEKLHPADPQKTIRAQYEGYGQEAENPGSFVETFVSMELASTDPRWKNVPLTLTTGKALNEKTTEIRVKFRKFNEAKSNELIFHIQPNEGVEIELFTKKPGYDREFETRNLAFTYPENTTLPDAYEQVLIDAIRSHKSLFTSSQEVLASWRVLQPLQNAWMMTKLPLTIYPVGSKIETIILRNPSR